MRQIKNTDLSPVYLFIAPPSVDVLRQRLSARKSDKPEAIEARLRMAIEELEYAATGAHDFVIRNDDFDRAYEKFEAVALGSEIDSDALPEFPKDDYLQKAPSQSAEPLIETPSTGAGFSMASTQSTAPAPSS